MRRFSPLSLYLIAATLFFGSNRVLSGQDAPEQPEAPPGEAVQIMLQAVPFQEVLNQLFGTPDTDSLLSGDQSVVLHAEDITLTPEEAKSFFAPSTSTETDFAALVDAFHDAKRGNVMIEGTVEGSPFDLKIAGRQLKLEGVNLTQDEFDSLLASLQDKSGLHQARIHATVDGDPVSVHLQNRAGRLRIQDFNGERIEEDLEEIEGARNPNRDRPNHENDGVRGAEKSDIPGHSQRAEKAGRIEAHERGRGPERLERIERSEKIERPERPERVERTERVERIERFERPEFAAGRGRR